ncbi:GIY-YIG nuclease family protein [Thiocapsa roseopersicina]|uniref:T5orf172 domain-containing protein n=1 Tax=Thiocapsa roseopersicina TaxID=1058 RepID=A0A1H2SJ61_THIRO|nr:GIY-YIG nuclease family protein [Thiocapsa roseopersicina]SDW31630.1 T5orf172 domain-containing protein [Thiocapsa roseopersicina]
MSYLYAWKLANQPVYKIGHGRDPRSRMRDYCRRHKLQAEENSLHTWECNENASSRTLEHLLHYLLEESRMVVGDGRKPQELFHIPEGFSAVERAVQKVRHLNREIFAVDNSQSNWRRFQRLGEEIRVLEERIREQHRILDAPLEHKISKNLRWPVIIVATFLYFLFSGMLAGILAGALGWISALFGAREVLLVFRSHGGGGILLIGLLIGAFLVSLMVELDNVKVLLDRKIEERSAAKRELPKLQAKIGDLETERDGLVQRLF